MKHFELDSNARNDQSNSRSKEELIPVDGRKQVLDMLRVADSAFREKLLRQIAARDAQLAYELRREL